MTDDILSCPCNEGYYFNGVGCLGTVAIRTVWFFVFSFFIYLFNFATRAGSPQQREPITVGPYYLPTLSTFPVGGNRSTRRKPTTFSRALTILFSHEDWVRVHIKMNLTGDRTRNLRGERRVVWPLHHRSPNAGAKKTSAKFEPITMILREEHAGGARRAGCASSNWNTLCENVFVVDHPCASVQGFSPCTLPNRINVVRLQSLS